MSSSNLESADTDKDLSWGVELEFLLYWRKTPYDEKNAPPSLVTRDEELAKPAPTDQDPTDQDKPDGPNGDDCDQEAGKKMIRKLFRDNNIHLYGDPDVSPLFPSIYLDPKTGWVVKDDSSVREWSDTSGLADWMMPGYTHCGIEINSPILRDTEAAHEHVHRVVRLLTDHHHIRVNPTCGLHVHVGAGTKLLPNPPSEWWQTEKGGESYQSVPFDFHTLQRAAMLLWAADPTLAALHPPERQFSTFSLSSRLESELSRKDPVSPIPIPPLPPLDDAERPRLPIHRAYTPHPSTVFRANIASTSTYEIDPSTITNTTALSGVAILRHRARNRQQLAKLLGYGGVRLNYNLAAYEFPVKLAPAVLLRRTVEFREAAGSVDADWIVVWACICKGIFSFCRGAEEKRFRRVIVRLAAAEQNKGGYDVVDLLRDMGLFTEAEFVLERHAKGVEAWYPGRISFLPGDPLMCQLSTMAETESRGTKVGEELKLKRKTREDLDEAGDVLATARALEHCPEYAAVYGWLKQALKDGGFGEALVAWELDQPTPSPTPEGSMHNATRSSKSPAEWEPLKPRPDLEW